MRPSEHLEAARDQIAHEGNWSKGAYAEISYEKIGLFNRQTVCRTRHCTIGALVVTDPAVTLPDLPKEPDYVQQRHWEEVLMTHTQTWCAGGHNRNSPEWHFLTQALHERCGHYYDATPHGEHRPGRAVETFNEQASHEEVLHLFDRAIELAQVAEEKELASQVAKVEEATGSVKA